MSPRTPVLNPSGYFAREGRPSLRVAAGIVTLDAVLTTILAAWFVQRVFAQIDLSEPQREMVSSAISWRLPVMFASVFVGWLLAGALLHTFMWFAGGDRGFGTTLAVVGESAMVSIALLPLVLVGFVLVIGRVPPEPAAAAEFIRRVTARQTGVLLIVGFVRTLWVGVVQAVGLSEVHGLELGRTLLVTIGLGVLGLLLG